MTKKMLAHTIHDGLLRNSLVAERDGRAESRGRDAYLNSTLTEGAASPAACALGIPVQACRDGKSSIAAEGFMENGAKIRESLQAGIGRHTGHICA